MSLSLPLDFPASPSSSSRTLTDVVTSCERWSASTPPSCFDISRTEDRRAQTFLSGSNITSSDAFPAHWETRRDEEEGLDYDGGVQNETESASDDDERTPLAVDIPDPLWDDALQPATTAANCSDTNEQTPLLLKKKVSFRSFPAPLGKLPRSSRPAAARRLSSSSTDVKYHSGGNSTFGQTLFNSTAILLGIGMLSEPLAFAYAGWGTGCVLIMLYGFITCYTAKILAHIVIADSSLRTYADIGYKAFGPKSTVLTGVLFCLELFGMSVVLVTLYGDSLHLVMPVFSSDKYKVLGLLAIFPTILMPLSVLSYTSVLGVLSTVLIIACIAIDGLSKREAPGSLWQPADTNWGVSGAGELGVSFGLFMAGFGGHAVIPSLARDMADPSQFNRMINWAFAIATVIYGIIGAAGYLMFGNIVSSEISKDILATPGYNVWLNKLAVWMLVIAPLSKFALATRPLNLTLEIWLGIDKPAKPPSPSRPPSPTSKSAAKLATSPRTTSHPWLLMLERAALAALAVGVSILVPDFSTVMAFLGSFSTFMLCVIGPVCAKIALQRTSSWYDRALLFIAIIMATWGTYTAFV